MLKCPIDQQLPQLGHLLNPEHDGALGSVQVKGQVAGERVQGRQGFAGVDQQGFGVLVGVYGEERWIGGRFDHDLQLRYVMEAALFRLHANEGGSRAQVCKTGHIGPRQTPKDLPRTAAITSTAGIKNAR